MPEHFVAREAATPVVGYFCTFRCPSSCSALFRSFAAFERHWRQRLCIPYTGAEPKGKEVTVSLMDVRPYTAEARYHVCGVCGMRVLADRRVIVLHLWRKHRRSLKSYLSVGGTERDMEDEEERFHPK